MPIKSMSGWLKFPVRKTMIWWIFLQLVVRIENYRVLEKLMLAVKPNTVINQLLDHLGDRRAATRSEF
jgi:hypothetical protein